MSEPFEAERRLERLLDRTLRGLPVRRAPATLESRVLAELARRAALPWWRRSFVHWPQAARAVFASMCLILAGLAFAAGGWAASGLKSLHAVGVWPISWAREAVAVMVIARSLSGISPAPFRRIGSMAAWLRARFCTRRCSDWASPLIARCISIRN